MVINMEELTPKKVSESKTEQIQILMPQHINGYKRLFGGVLMEWIDVVAGVVARRHANSEVTTASVDNLQFKSPAYVNSTIILIGKITYVGTTSMEVRVETFVESLSGERKLVNRAYVVMVALDEHERPEKSSCRNPRNRMRNLRNLRQENDAMTCVSSGV